MASTVPSRLMPAVSLAACLGLLEEDYSRDVISFLGVVYVKDIIEPWLDKSREPILAASYLGIVITKAPFLRL